MNSDHQKDFVGIDSLDLSMMASKVAYENPAYIQKVVKDNWKMHFVRFFNCWNDILEDYTTQAFIFSDKAKDATKIYVAFRGTEPFDANDWKTDIDLSFISLNLDGSGKYTGRVHIGFLGALGLLKNFDPKDVFPEDKPSGVTQPMAYYTIREVLNNMLKTNPKADILLTGHSLGGALAILFSFLLHAHKQTEILNSMDRVMTYGQPRVGDYDFASYMENFTGSLHQRMVYRYDLVPRVPFDLSPFSSFKHCGTCTYYTCYYDRQVVDEVPNPNYFDMWYLSAMYSKACSDLVQALIIGITEGSDYAESCASIFFRIFGLIIPGVASHSPRDYINAGRLSPKKSKKDLV